MSSTDPPTSTLMDYRDEEIQDPSFIFPDGEIPDKRPYTVSIRGSPGSGKTSMIAGLGDKLKGVKDHLIDDCGYDLTDIRVTSFSTTQTDDLESEMPELADEDRISTLHSLNYSECNVGKLIVGDWRKDKDKIEEFRSEYLSFRENKELKYPNGDDRESSGSTICGDIYAAYEYIFNSNSNINKMNIYKCGVDCTKYNMSVEEFMQLVEDYHYWLMESEYDTFASISSRAASKGDNSEIRTDTECLIVDEGQDLADVQVEYVRSLMDGLDVLITIRDDDQSIYSYKSENVGSRIIEDPDEVIRQNETYRCSKAVANFAGRLGDFELTSARPRTGSVDLDTRDIGDIVVELGNSQELNDKTDVYILCRTRTQLDRLEDLLISSNIGYSGINRSYVTDDPDGVRESIEGIRNGDLGDYFDESKSRRQIVEDYCNELELSDKEVEMVKRVTLGDETYHNIDVEIGTYHGSKGLEANSVILCSDWISHRKSEHQEERRIAYVGATRARDDLRVTSIGQGRQNSILRNVAAELGGGR